MTTWILAATLIAASVVVWRVKEPWSDDFPRPLSSYSYISLGPGGSLTALDAATTHSPPPGEVFTGGVRLNGLRATLALREALTKKRAYPAGRWGFVPVRVVETAEIELYPWQGHEELFRMREEEIRALAIEFFQVDPRLMDPTSFAYIRHPSCIVEGTSPVWIWWPGVGYNVVHVLRFALPAILLVWAGLSFRRAWKRAWGQIRIQEGCCPACGYPLDPSHSETCPECGRRADDVPEA